MKKQCTFNVYDQFMICVTHVNYKVECKHQQQLEVRVFGCYFFSSFRLIGYIYLNKIK